jgi:hypothetical protein
MASNIFSNLITALSSATGATASAIGSTIGSVFSGHYSKIRSALVQLQQAGPGADPNQLNGMLAGLTNLMSQTTAVPGMEYAAVATLKGLVGKADPQSEVLWSQTITNAISVLDNASSVS